MLTKEEQLVWKTLSGLPVSVIDRDKNELWENEIWELVSAREDGTREIGSANMISAYNIVYQINLQDSDILAKFRSIMSSLEQQKLIRRKPSIVRQSFRVI